MKRFTFYYDYKEPQKDSFKCDAETEEEAWKLFDKETEYLDDVEVEFHSEDELPAAPIEPDPNQLTFQFSEAQ